MSEALRRLRWKSRRGMLELDLALTTFLDSGFNALSLEEKQLFESLLELEDTVLFAWVLGHEEVDEPRYQLIVSKIQASLQRA